jgi:hypothetical protein
MHLRLAKSPDECAWDMCDKGPEGKSAKRREKSKYCSIYCKNKNARHRYNLRKKGLLVA